MNKVQENEDIIIEGLKDIIQDAYNNALEGRTDYFETHTVNDVIREYESETGCAATEFFITFAVLVRKYSLEAIAKGRAKRESLNT